MARRVFYSFHFRPDNWRAATVRNIGAIEGNRPAPDNDWHTIVNSGEDAIKRWINDQMYGRSCTIVLVGSETANRKWINYEIVRSWNEKMGIVGICVHGLKNSEGNIATQGQNPFDCINYGNNGRKLSSIVKCYNPAGSTSQERYDWITRNIENAVEEAIRNRNAS